MSTLHFVSLEFGTSSSNKAINEPSRILSSSAYLLNELKILFLLHLSAVSLLEREPHSEPLPQGARRAARGSLTAELNGRGKQDEASSKGHSFVELMLTKKEEEIQVID